MTSPEKAENLLTPWLGSDFLARNRELPARLALMLFAFQPDRGNLAELRQALDNSLFMAVREDTKGRLALLMDNGRLIRLRMEDFAVMADELLYLLFEALPKTPAHLRLIQEYSLRSGSLSAIKALYLHYRGMQTPEETQTLRRVITSCHAPFRWQGWIDEDQDETQR